MGEGEEKEKGAKGHNYSQFRKKGGGSGRGLMRPKKEEEEK